MRHQMIVSYLDDGGHEKITDLLAPQWERVAEMSTSRLIWAPIEKQEMICQDEGGSSQRPEEASSS